MREAHQCMNASGFRGGPACRCAKKPPASMARLACVRPRRWNMKTCMHHQACLPRRQIRTSQTIVHLCHRKSDDAMTLTIYGTADSRTMRVLWAANELGLDFTHV